VHDEPWPPLNRSEFRITALPKALRCLKAKASRISYAAEILVLRSGFSAIWTDFLKTKVTANWLPITS